MNINQCKAKGGKWKDNKCVVSTPKKSKKFNYLHLIWIVPIGAFVLIAMLVIGGFAYVFYGTPYGDDCQAWRIDGFIDVPGTGTPSPTMFEQNCPTGWVCVPPDKEVFCQEKYGVSGCSGGSWDLSEGHTIDNPAEGICKGGISGIWGFTYT